MLGHSGGSRDDTNAPIEAIPLTGVLSVDRLNQWQAELGQFVAEARLKLDALARSLEQQRSAHEAAPAETTRNAACAETPLAQHGTPQHGISQHGIAEHAPADSPGTLRNAESLPVSGVEPIRLSGQDGDLVDRLSAIKLRLAKQIQNT